MSYRHHQLSPQIYYANPNKKFGGIVNPNLVISRNINKDLMVPSSRISEVKSISKKTKYPSRYGRNIYYNMKHYMH